MFFLLKQIVMVRVPIYAVPDDKNQPKFRTGSTWVLGMIETVPLTVRQPYIVRVAHDHCVSAIPEELAQAHDIDPTRAADHLKMYSWPSEFQARRDAAACARRLTAPTDAPTSPQPCPVAANANQPSIPNQRAAVIPPAERVMLQPEPPKPPRRRGKRRARRPTTPPSQM